MSRKHSQKPKQPSSRHVAQQRRNAKKRNRVLFWVGLGVLCAVVAGFLLFSPRESPSVEITPAQAYEKFQQGAFFLDVRSQAEWEQVHIAGSTLIPLDELPDRLNELPKDQDIVVVCLSGHRSQEGTTILLEAGFTHVSCLSGGLQAWMDANYPTEQGSP
jgi:rhodanese-related sulfurtransferase